jgi:tRNA (guanine37-N1)-methyltransferase
MIKFDILTIFPNIFDSYLEESFIRKAREKGLLGIDLHDIRQFACDARKSVDDRPYGGGLGMVLKVEPILKTLADFLKLEIKGSRVKIVSKKRAASAKAFGAAGRQKSEKAKIILFTPRGEQFNQKMAYRLSKLDRVIMICGRYEGVDERVAKNIADMEVSVGPYDLMGGELPAMIVMETIARLVPGVLGKPDFLKERVSKEKGFIESVQYTRPESFDPSLAIKPGKRNKRPAVKTKPWAVPDVLLKGNHKDICKWREEHQKNILE